MHYSIYIAYMKSARKIQHKKYLLRLLDTMTKKRKHGNVSDADKIHVCEHENCDYRTNRKYSLKIHILTHTQQKDVSCEHPGCDKKFISISSMRSHKKTHSDERNFPCIHEGCQFRGRTQSVLNTHLKIHSGVKPHACDFPGCEFSCIRHNTLLLHKMTHLESNIHCNHPGCDYSTNSPLNLQTHMLRHLEVLPFPCEEDGCDFTTTTRGQLETHHRCVHSDNKHYECTFPGCDFTSKLQGNLKQHMVTHSEELPFACDWDNCDFRTKTNACLKRHMLGHTGRELKFICPEERCDYKTAYKNHLHTHMRMHTKDYKYQCSSCEYKTISSSHLARHMLVHDESRIHSCEFPSCDYETTNIDRFNRHKKTHTPEGQIRHKKQEKRVTKMLTHWDYQYDPEVTINASRGNCLTDTNRHYSRLDYNIINCTSAVLLLEVDEDQHQWYNLSCEFSRMADIRASLLKAGITKPIYWIRYNPNGKYHVDFEEVKISREKRELVLKAKLEELCSPDFVPENEVSIHYLFYDLMSEDMGPEIMYDSAFPEVMRSVVSWK